MKYLCLCYYDIEIFAHLSQSELEAIGPACRPHDAILHDTGKVLYLGSLAEPQDWRTIKPSGQKPVVTDGPFTKISEQAGAFIIIEADNMDEAIEVASKHAAANYGEHLGFAVEVRLCESFD